MTEGWWVARFLLFWKMTAQKCCEHAVSSYIQFMVCTQLFEKVHKSLGFMCGRWSTNHKIYRILETWTGLKVDKRLWGQIIEIELFESVDETVNLVCSNPGCEAFTKSCFKLLRDCMLAGLFKRGSKPQVCTAALKSLAVNDVAVQGETVLGTDNYFRIRPLLQLELALVSVGRLRTAYLVNDFLSPP